MAGRGVTTFKKRQKEMQRKERQQEKFEKRMERKKQVGTDDPSSTGDIDIQDTQDAPGPSESPEACYPKVEV